MQVIRCVQCHRTWQAVPVTGAIEAMVQAFKTHECRPPKEVTPPGALAELAHSEDSASHNVKEEKAQ